MIDIITPRRGARQPWIRERLGAYLCGPYLIDRYTYDRSRWMLQFNGTTLDTFRTLTEAKQAASEHSILTREGGSR